MKPGIKTSEFWMAVVTMICGFLKAQVWPDFPVEAFLGSIGYIFFRSGLKAVEIKKNGSTP